MELDDIRNLSPGKYSVLSYEVVLLSNPGRIYKICCTSDNGKTILSVRGDSFTTYYFTLNKPKKKFNIVIQNKNVYIVTSSPKIDLK